MESAFRKRGKKGEKNGKGLRHFSMKVCEKVQKKGVTTYNEVADELVAEFSSSDNHMSPNDAVSAADQRGPRPSVWLVLTPCVSLKHVYDQKNIRRRVYDALNVLMAMNIISKEKKEIKWIGLPTNSAQECQNLEVRPPPLFFFVGGTLLFPKLRFSAATLPTGGATKTAGEDQTEAIPASGAHPAGEWRRPGPQPHRRPEATAAPLHFNRRPSCSAANSV